MSIAIAPGGKYAAYLLIESSSRERGYEGNPIRQPRVRVPAPSGPVSYTHLDVYKRQAAVGEADAPGTDEAAGLGDAAGPTKKAPMRNKLGKRMRPATSSSLPDAIDGLAGTLSWVTWTAGRSAHTAPWAAMAGPCLLYTSRCV